VDRISGRHPPLPRPAPLSRPAVRAGLVLLAAAGLALYLWPAIQAPVVLWSDSALDLEWARTGAGIFHPVSDLTGDAAIHPIKPGYLAFLAVATRALPGVAVERSAVVVQTVLLWGSIAATAFFVGRRRGIRCGIFLYAALISFLRLRDSASAVMSEALAAAMFLPIAAFAVELPESRFGLIGAGVAVSILTSVRPNLGALAAAVLTVSLLAARRFRALAAFAAVVALLTIGTWLATKRAAGPDPLRGIGYPVLEASLDYYWRPSLGPWPPPGTPVSAAGRADLALAKEHWKQTLARRGPDARRELGWRALHGIFGIEYYDARWSEVYRRIDEAARVISPFLLIAGIACAIEALFRRRRDPGREPDHGRVAGIIGILFVPLLVAHDLVLGPNPRYLLPALTLFLILLARGLGERRPEGAGRAVAIVVILSTVIGLLLLCQRQTLDWQWGRIERAGVGIVQEIPRGAIPEAGVSTLHVRLGSPDPASGARFRIEGPEGRTLEPADPGHAGGRPYATVAIPGWLAQRNQSGPVSIRVFSEGDFGPVSYLLFPVIPPPWSPAARREDSTSLSPTTGIDRGGLDWWIHAGAD
jgi:hypothetical protein